MAKRGTKAWKMNISASRGGNRYWENIDLPCPWCRGKGQIENPGYIFRWRREMAGQTQGEFVANSAYGRTTIQEVERGIRKPPCFSLMNTMHCQNYINLSLMIGLEKIIIPNLL